MYTAVIFDLNGVILQGELLSNCFQSSFGVPKEDFLPALKEIMKIVRQPNTPSVFSLWKPYLTKWGIKFTESELLDFWCSAEKVTPGFLEYLSHLHSLGIKIFILSNNFRERTQYYRQNFPEIFQNIDKVYFSWETGLVKPSVEALNLLLSENNLTPGDCIFFDDSQENVDPATSLGIHAKKWLSLENAKITIES
jgi:HAD superfamily hydrolase (TIGR01509 family)